MPEFCIDIDIFFFMNILLKFSVQLFTVILFYFILLQINGNKLRDGHNNDKKNTNTTRSNNITLKKIQANIFYLHFNKNFITLDLKM